VFSVTADPPSQLSSSFSTSLSFETLAKATRCCEKIQGNETNLVDLKERKDERVQIQKRRRA